MYVVNLPLSRYCSVIATETSQHYSAPELEELIEATNRVCDGKSGKTPALVVVNTPPAKAGGFGLRLKAGSIGPSADYP